MARKAKVVKQEKAKIEIIKEKESEEPKIETLNDENVFEDENEEDEY